MHVNIKRLLSFLVVLAMVLSMTPVTGIPAIEAKAETTETTTEETVATSATADLVLDSESKAVCAHCNEEVVWTAIANGGVIGNVTTTGNMHYYLSEDNTSTGNFVNFTTGTTAETEVCLHLNGHNLNTAKGFILQNQGKLNLLGNGAVKRTAAGLLFEIWTTTVNIYGGTFQTTPSAYNVADASEAKVAKLASVNSKVTLHNNATMDGEVMFANGKLTLTEGWTGSIGKLEVGDALWAEGGESILATKLQVDGSFTGSIISEMHHMVLQDGLLTKGEEVVFDATAATNYCEHCAKYVTWTPLSAGEIPDGTADHYYLSADISNTGYFIKGDKYKSSGTTYNSVCLQLNGKTLTTASGSAEGYIYGSNGTIISIMGDGTVVNNGSSPLITTDTSRVNLYGGTYISATKNAINIRGGNSYLHLYGDAKLEGAAAISNGKVYINDSASLKGNLNHTGGTITVATDWTGSLKNAEGKYYELVDGVWTVVTKTPVWGVFDPEACDGKAYCEHCGEEAGAQTWTAFAGKGRFGAVGATDNNLVAGTHYHYYLSGDLNATAYTQVLSMSEGVSVCLNLNGYDITSAGRMLATSTGTLAIMGDGNVTMTGERTTDSESYREATINVTTSGGAYLYGGTYSVTGNAVTEGRPTIKASKPVTIKNATVNGYIAANAGSTIKLEGTTVAEDIRIDGSGKVVVAAGWSGTASLTVADSAFENGVLAAANGAAEGDFTGTLTCNGVELFNENGTLMADTTFDPDAATNYCSECKAYVAWTALSGDVKIGVVETGLEEGSDVHEHYYLSGDVNYTGTDDFVNVKRAGTIQTASSVCLKLNGKTLNTTGPIRVSHGCNLTIFGEGGTVNYTGTTGWYIGTSNFKLYGGTYNGVVAYTDGSGPKVYLYDGAAINGVLRLFSGKLWLYGTSSINKLVQGYNATYPNHTLTLDSEWTGNLVVDAADVMVDGKIPAAKAVVTGGVLNGTVTDTNGNVFVYADGQLGINTTFDPDAETNYCRVCNATVKWESLPEKVETIPLDGTHYHYYVAEDMEYAETLLFYAKDNDPDAPNVAPKVCLYLNNKTLTLKDCIYGSNGGTFNIIGDGTLTTKAGYALRGATSYIHLYGGTYTAPTSGGVYSRADAGTPHLYVHEDADLQGNVLVTVGTVDIYDQAKIAKLTIEGGKTTFKAGWTGSAAVTVADSLITDSTVNVANAYVEDGATGTLTDLFGAAITVTNNALVMPENTLDPEVFDPWNHNGYAYCDCVICGEQNLVQWINFNDYKKELGDNTLSDTSGTYTLHFYLSEDLNYSGNVLSSYEHIIFNLNGHNINPVAKDGETEITATYAFSCTQKLVLMNTAETMSTVTGWQTAAGNATVIHMGGGGASSKAYLYDNVTLTTHADCTTDAPVVRAGSNGGTFYMEGGIIDASNKTNTGYPSAVYIEGQPEYTSGGKTYNGPGAFYMNGGEIKGGTSVNAGGAVQIGSSASGATYQDGASFYMTGGTISGGKSTNGGNLFINKNASEAVITGGTITDGEATVSGGNIYCHTANLTIGEQATISDGFIPFTNMSTFGIGGGNIYFANGTLTTSGVITGGTIEKFKGAGGNVFLDGNGGDISFIMNGGEISDGQIPVGDEEIYGGADPEGQNYGANIRGYKVKEIKLLGGTIEGGIGGNDIKADGRDVYIACHDSVVTDMTIGNVTINGAIHLAKHKLTLKDAPVINSVDGKNALTVGEAVEVNISGLTEGADVEFSGVTPNVPFTVACDNVETVKNYITVIDCGAPLTVQNGQLILVGVAIVGGEEAAWYADNKAAVAAYTAEDYAAGKYIQLGLDTALALAGGEYLIDLAGNGDAAEVAITGTGIAHLFDSANADFDGFRTATVADTITLVRDNDVIVDGEAIRYITITDAEGKTSAHALVMAITGVNLRTDAAGLYYSANYNCDEVLAELVSAYGVILSLNDMPGAVKTSDDQRTELTDFAPGAYATSSSVFGIFKDTRTAAKNAQYGKMKIYANAYVQLDVDGDGVAETLVADNENVGKKAGNAWSLHDVLVTIDQNWAAYAKDQEAVTAFYDQWYDLGMSAYADDFTNIDVKIDVEGGEGEGVTPKDDDVDVPV